MDSLGKVGVHEIQEGLGQKPLQFIDEFQKKNEIDPEIGIVLLNLS